MTCIKFCGLTRFCDIDFANELKPEFIGFVFAHKSKRYITPEHAAELRARLSPEIKSVGVFVDENINVIAEIASRNIIDAIQLHGSENEDYIRQIRALTGKTIIKAFVINSPDTLNQASQSNADYILLDNGMGTGETFDWDIIQGFTRDYFLAGGLNPENVGEAVRMLSPFAVDTSSGIETNGFKDKTKMAEFIERTRNMKGE